jgi:hypothetical protein
LSVFSSSCNTQTDYTKEIYRLDSAEIMLNESEKIIMSADTNSFRVSYNVVSENLHTIVEKLAEDTVNKKTALLLSNAYKQLGSILNLLNNKKYLEQFIRETKQRIHNLKHDLSENLIEKNKAQEYVVNEMNEAQKIHHLITTSVEKAKVSAAKLDSLKTEINFLADSLSEK